MHFPNENNLSLEAVTTFFFGRNTPKKVKMEKMMLFQSFLFGDEDFPRVSLLSFDTKPRN